MLTGLPTALEKHRQTLPEFLIVHLQKMRSAVLERPNLYRPPALSQLAFLSCHVVTLQQSQDAWAQVADSSSVLLPYMLGISC